MSEVDVEFFKILRKTKWFSKTLRQDNWLFEYKKSQADILKHEKIVKYRIRNPFLKEFLTEGTSQPRGEWNTEFKQGNFVAEKASDESWIQLNMV